MENKSFFIGILAIMLVFAMTAVGCGEDPADDNGNGKPQTVTYKNSDTAGNAYTLTITENKSRAAYKPRTGDNYELTIKKTGMPNKVSKGTISNVGAGSKITLQPETANSPTFDVYVDNSKITAITGPITLADGTTTTAGDFEEGQEPSKPDNAFTSIEAMGTWLSAQPANTAATAYTVKLIVNDLENIKATFDANNTKYVYLDLSGSTITTIPEDAFYTGAPLWTGCVTLVGITIPDSVTSIGGQAFYNCTSLTSVTIGNSVTEIGRRAFYYCTILAAINVNSSNTAYSSQDGVLFNKAKTTLIQYPAGKTNTSFTIPNSVTSIELVAFADCTSLASVTIPNSVTSIGEGAFSYCTSLTSITIPDSVTSIRGLAFRGCSSLTSVTFQGTINNLGSGDAISFYSPFDGDLSDKYLSEGIGTYTTTAPVSRDSVWIKQN